MTHIARGVDSKGNLNVDIVLSGYVPELPLEVNFEVLPYVEDYVQTGPGAIYAYSSRLYNVNKHPLPYAWNHSISYDARLGRMPYIVQQLSTQDISVDFDISRDVLKYQLSAFIDKGGC